MQLEFSQYSSTFEKYSNIKFLENSSSGRRVAQCGRTDVQNEAKSWFMQFFERVWKWVEYKDDPQIDTQTRCVPSNVGFCFEADVWLCGLDETRWECNLLARSCNNCVESSGSIKDVNLLWKPDRVSALYAMSYRLIFKTYPLSSLMTNGQNVDALINDLLRQYCLCEEQTKCSLISSIEVLSSLCAML